MHATEHPLHTSRTEMKLQWMAIVFMAIGLITSMYFHYTTLKSERVKSEITSYLHLNDRYHKLLFTLIHNNADNAKKGDVHSLQENKYIIYELFELFSTIDSFQQYFTTLDDHIWPVWKKRMEFLFSKPAIHHAWIAHRKDAEKIYNSEFIEQVEGLLAHAPLELGDIK